jgi:hypothetical protein
MTGRTTIRFSLWIGLFFQKTLVEMRILWDLNREWEDIFSQKNKINIFYADEDTTAKKHVFWQSSLENRIIEFLVNLRKNLK